MVKLNRIGAGLIGGVMGAVLVAAELPAIANTSQSRQIPDGVYVYGETAQPNQIGTAYMVFEARDNQLVGGFYMPQSSFDCFQGTYQGDRLDLTVQATYEDMAYPYSVAVHSDALVASQGAVGAPMQLMGFQPLPSMSDTDSHVLNTCRANAE